MRIFRSVKLVLLILFLVIAFGINNVEAESSDLIAVRILPNPEHYSALRWYQEQGFTGSPQSIKVDGYDAVRDGRTVYVNAVNADTSNNVLYTNIYLISYNQDYEQATVDILDRIVNSWSFNDNLSSEGVCNISNLSCTSNDQCSENYQCDEEAGKCVVNTEKMTLPHCLIDSDCPKGLFCDSEKARVIRDVRRLATVTELKERLEEYYGSYGTYPALASGTYLPYTSVSTWPSWSENLSSKLGVTLVDPVNSLGPCPGYDRDTCWSTNLNKFYDPIDDNDLDLPTGSLVMVYEGAANGAYYDLCAVMESGFTMPDGSLTAAGCDVAWGQGYSSGASNSAPLVVEKQLSGRTGEEFRGALKVVDLEGHSVTWSLSSPGTSWSSPWSAAPVLQSTGDPNQRRLYAAKAGPAGEYDMSLQVCDNKGACATEPLVITIENNGPIIRAGDVDYTANLNDPLQYSLYFEDDNLGNAADFYHVLTVNYNLADDNTTHSYPVGSNNIGYGLTKNIIKVAEGKFRLDINGLLNSNLITIPQKTNFNFNFSVWDSFDNLSTASFIIEVDPDQPIFDFECPSSIRLGEDYFCKIRVKNGDRHLISYDIEGLPAGLGDGSGGGTPPPSPGMGLLDKIWQKIQGWWLSINSPVLAEEEFNTINIEGKPTVAGSYLIKVTAMNEFGAYAEKEFTINVNTYCGDGVIQGPNLEKRGGLYDNGYEYCDINAGVATTVGESNIFNQYKCSTSERTSYPLESDTCYPNCCIPVGGFCGDGICQVNNESNNPALTDKYCLVDCGTTCESECSENQVCWEGTCRNTCSSNEDCDGGMCSNGFCLKNGCSPQCDGKECGPDGCYGWCGSCPAGEKCEVDTGQCIAGCVTNADCGPNQTCSQGVCLKSGCTPACTGKKCGDDGCGGSCGSCNAGEACVDNQCVTNCARDCVGKECGSDGCGGSCGACASGETCNNNGSCVSDCTPNCTGKDCGSDGCGGSCGSCTLPESCVGGTTCALLYSVYQNAQCLPSCYNGYVCDVYGLGARCESQSDFCADKCNNTPIVRYPGGYEAVISCGDCSAGYVCDSYHNACVVDTSYKVYQNSTCSPACVNGNICSSGTC